MVPVSPQPPQNTLSLVVSTHRPGPHSVSPGAQTVLPGQPAIAMLDTSSNVQSSLMETS
jgi:hypothetical protein